MIEQSVSLSATSYLSNGSSSFSASRTPEFGQSLENISLNKLSSNLETLLGGSEFDCSDAEIIVGGIPVGVHKCIVSARSKFFRKLFMRDSLCSGQEKKRTYHMNELVSKGNVGYEAFRVILCYIYTGKMRPTPIEASTCADEECAHAACGPAVSFAVEMLYASCTFQLEELIPIFQRRLHNFIDKAVVEDVIPILHAGFNCQITELQSHCVQRIARSDLDSVSMEKELPSEISEEVMALRLASCRDSICSVIPMHEKRVRRIHRALDSDDIELVRLLLSESDITLDDANALHYAVAYCDSKVVAALLDLNLANVNLKNGRGYTPLHLAARRKEPDLIVSLLNKRASALEMTSDGQCAARICRRVTRAKDFYAKTEQGKETNNGRLCIDVLERELRKPIMREEPFCPGVADDLYVTLLYLENRVAFAKLLFPTEAKVAMKIANVEGTTEFGGLSESKNAFGNLREVDLNETPSVQLKRLRSRMDALTKTVALGRRYFPNCSQVLDKLLEDDLDDLPTLLYSTKGTPDEQEVKRIRFSELKNEVLRAFSRDKAKTSCSGLSSSSSSSSFKEDVEYRKALKM